MSSGNGALCTLYGLTIKLLRPLSSPDVQTSTGSGSSLRLRVLEQKMLVVCAGPLPRTEKESLEPQILEIGILKFSSEDTEATRAVPQLDQHMLMALGSVSTQQVCL
ncbi:hypothetical protein Peur_022554 [Populus x canadensis]